ncbi:MAG: hypothetical protein HRT94_02195 [Alphaproteobacteria bacterium]|nr:hypothetical protein [Alphaproteobacteria bacterium]
MTHYIPLQTAKEIIVVALNDFDAELGRRAAEILTDDLRANIHEVPSGTGQMMACRPAGITLDDLQKMDMYMPDFEQRFAPNFTRQDNPEDYAIVDFEYDGTTNSLIYLGHEIGHAIADDLQRERGLSFRNFPTDQLEKQAYFVQSSLQHYLHEHGADHGIDYKNPEQDDLQTSWARAAQLKASNNTFQKTLAVTEPGERSTLVVAALTENTDQDGLFADGSVAMKTLNANSPQSLS